jgi:hypothetical protein
VRREGRQRASIFERRHPTRQGGCRTGPRRGARRLGPPAKASAPSAVRGNCPPESLGIGAGFANVGPLPVVEGRGGAETATAAGTRRQNQGGWPMAPSAQQLMPAPRRGAAVLHARGERDGTWPVGRALAGHFPPRRSGPSPFMVFALHRRQSQGSSHCSTRRDARTCVSRDKHSGPVQVEAKGGPSQAGSWKWLWARPSPNCRKTSSR